MTETPLSTGGPPSLRVRALCKSFGLTRALDDVSLELAPGVVHAVVELALFQVALVSAKSRFRPCSS